MAPEAQDTLCRRIPAIALNFATTTGERTPLRAAETLRVPTLLLHGSRTRPITRRTVERLTWTLPNATLREIEGDGHMLPLAHPATAAQAVRSPHTRPATVVVPFREPSH